jgi:hypothetical protein
MANAHKEIDFSWGKVGSVFFKRLSGRVPRRMSTPALLPSGDSETSSRPSRDRFHRNWLITLECRLGDGVPSEGDVTPSRNILRKWMLGSPAVSGGSRMFHTQRWTFALGMTLFLGLTAPVRAQVTEPFTGEGEAIITDFQGGTYRFAAEGLGEPLGHFGGEGAFVVTDDGGIYGKVKLFNADQDTVYAAFIAQLQDDGSYAGTLTIVGGEGRFAGASGSADLWGQMFNASFTVAFDGTITY